MAPPLVTIYVTSLTSQPKVRKHIDLLHRSLKGLEIPYESYDLVIDEDAKKRWQRAKPAGVAVGLPGYLVGGQWVGTMEDFEDAVESGTLEAFLKQDVDVGAAGIGTVEDDELEALMREMTTEDLDALASQFDKGRDAAAAGGVGKAGLIMPAGEEAQPPAPLEEGKVGGGENVKDEETVRDETGVTVGKVETTVPAAVAAKENEADEKEDGPAPSEKTLDEVVDRAITADTKEKLD
ncbi:hypothetical protein Q5752_001802 [Cryptotrichosporon argae]